MFDGNHYRGRAFRGRKFCGLALPEPVLRKTYHENAVRWVPGIVSSH